VFFGVLGFSFVQGAFTLSNENFLFVFNYIFWGWSFFSCFFYPVEALPNMLQPIVQLNPVYHALFIIRGLWMHGQVAGLAVHAAYVLSFAVVSPIISSIIFNKMIDKYGISGY